MSNKIISQEAIENLKQLIRNRNSYLDIKEVFDNLEDLPSQEKIKVNPKSTTISANSGAQDLVLSANDTKTPDIFKEEICQTCGFPKSWGRNPVFIKDDIFSLMNVEENTCKECGHQADGYTIKKIQPLLKRYKEAGIKDILKDLKLLLHKGIRSQIHEYEIRDIINKYGEEDEIKN